MPWRIAHHQCLASTNAEALDLIHTALAHGKDFAALRGQVILADQQTAGRGQHGRRWTSPPGGLYMTAILGDLPPELRPLAPLLAGAAVAQAIERDGISAVGLRWPNDVVIHGRKVAGILCEGLATGAQWIAIAGIGVNVNTPPDAFEPPLIPRTTTLLACDGRRRHIPALTQAILEGLAHWLTRPPEEIITEIRRRDVLRDKQVTLAHPDGLLTGIATGINAQGALCLTSATGPQTITTGSIQSVDGQTIR